MLELFVKFSLYKGIKMVSFVELMVLFDIAGIGAGAGGAVVFVPLVLV